MKAAMKLAELDSGTLRMPLWEMDEGPLMVLKGTLEKAGLLP